MKECICCHGALDANGECPYRYANGECPYCDAAQRTKIVKVDDRAKAVEEALERLSKALAELREILK